MKFIVVKYDKMDYLKNILRLLLVFTMFHYTLSWGIFPMLGIHGENRSQPSPMPYDPGNGMGGMSYLENNSSEIMDPALPADTVFGIPEPKEFSKPQMLLYTAYTVKSGDTISDLARNFGLNQDTLISYNNVKQSRLLQIGQVLKIPNQDGVLHMVKKGDTLAALAEKYQTDAGTIQTVNELFSENIIVGSRVFIPGARLDWMDLQEINGDLFMWPVYGYLTSPYGYRSSPFTGARQFHSGIDIGAAKGTPIRAAMGGRVIAVSYDDSYGNYVVITHHGGYRTLYGHMNVARVKPGVYVAAGERIGDVGSTGRSTGPHLHFTVYKNGVTVNPRTLLK
ncbi:M23 family metallopeptidase [Treponema sp. TIM-1]|uniref:LysM peptidoglycan-binding domain-containing M23 family metallopeptidase n=1 Tax=Treponema sp. TIM-1 TaxID=2898417 RepID=UPI00397FBCAF